MKKQIYIFTRLFNVHDRIAALELCEEIEKRIKEGEIRGEYKCFLPYRDSNEKVKEKKNKTYEIFKMDCKSIMESDILVGYMDGPIYDSGIGFEIGYAYLLGKKIIIMSSDYFLVQREIENRCSICTLVESMGEVIHIKEMKGEKSYKNGLIKMRKALWNEMTKAINKEVKKYKEEMHKISEKYEYFIDIAFFYFESGKGVWHELEELLLKEKLTYYVPKCQDYKNVNDLIERIKRCKKVVVYGERFELSIESSIMQGLAYGLGKKILLYATENLSLFQDKDFILFKNPMIEHSANNIVDTYRKTIQNDI